jgi:hypothetical protein
MHQYGKFLAQHKLETFIDRAGRSHAGKTDPRVRIEYWESRDVGLA